MDFGSIKFSSIDKWGNKIVDPPSAGYLHYNGAQFVWDTPGTGNWTAPSVNTIGTGLEVVNGVIAINFVPITSENDPTIYAWAKAATKPSYTYSEVGAEAAFSTLGISKGGTGRSSYSPLEDDHFLIYNHSLGILEPSPYTYLSFLSSETDPTVYAWAKAATKPSYTYSEVGAASSTHNHDVSYATPGYVAANYSVLGHGHDGTTIGDLTVADFTSSNISQWTNNAGYITSESDPSVYAWAKAATKPSYTASEIGAESAFSTLGVTKGGTGKNSYSPLDDNHFLIYNHSLGILEPSPYTYLSFLSNETDPTVYAWAKAATKPSYTYSEVGAEAYITRSTGFLKWGGSSWTWDGNSYSLSSHNHDSAYHPLVSGGKTITYSVEDGNLDVWTSQYSNGVLISLKKNGVEQ